LWLADYHDVCPVPKIRATTPSSRREPPVAWQEARVNFTGEASLPRGAPTGVAHCLEALG